MKTLAVIKNGVVVNCILWDGLSAWAPDAGTEAVDVTGTDTCIGWTFDGLIFTAPIPDAPIEGSV